MKVEIIAPGTRVKIVRPSRGCDIGDGLLGLVISADIRHAGVSYRVAWWDDETRYDDWLEPFEIEAIEDE